MLCVGQKKKPTITQWYSFDELGNTPSLLTPSNLLFQVALPAKGVSKRRPVVASQMQSQPVPHVSLGVR